MYVYVCVCVKTIDSEERPQMEACQGWKPDVWITKNNAMDKNISERPQGSPRGGENEISIKTDQSETNQAFRPRTITMICQCGKKCKNIRGLKIHQACMKCQVE